MYVQIQRPKDLLPNDLLACTGEQLSSMNTMTRRNFAHLIHQSLKELDKSPTKGNRPGFELTPRS